MNPEGNVYNAMGRINRLSVLVVSAYDIALKHGFEGTEEEWLASLKATVSDEQVAKAVESYFERNPIPTSSNGLERYVELLAANWVTESEEKHSQVVSIDCVTENSKVDLTPTEDQLIIWRQKELAFTTKNIGGVVTVYAIGQKPENDYTIQVTITEVEE